MTYVRPSVCLLLLVLGVVRGQLGDDVPILGGWSTQDVNSNPRFHELAHYAVSSKTEGLANFDTVLELLEVETQTVAGTNYRLKFKTAETDCRIGEVQYSKEACPPKSTNAKATCTAVINERTWENHLEVLSYGCE